MPCEQWFLQAGRYRGETTASNRWFSIEHARAHDAYVKRQMTSLPLDSGENYDLCTAGPGSGGVDRKS